jgi:cytochrome c peroxidase
VVTLDVDGPRPWVRLAEDPLSAQAAMGRKLFYNGTDEVTSGGMGCAGCHPEGRDDGHVWHEAFLWGEERRFFAGKENIPDFPTETRWGGFPRQTPMLAGRLIAEGPYGWHGESPHLTHRLTNGFRLHRWGQYPYGHQAKDLHERAMALRAFLRQGLVPPPVRAGELTEEEKKGKEVFMRVDTKCAGCHVPEMNYSDRAPYPVYAKLPTPEDFGKDPEAAYKTPSLRFVGGSAPYAHDGRYSTLEELIELNDDRMGNTKQLTKPERDALVAFLRTL